MRDGARLHTFICRPKAGNETSQKFPVILTRTCYPNQDNGYRTYAEEFAKRGYIYIYQYSRGREKSEGIWIPNENEREDGIDTVCWIHRQPWCKNIGYWGYSYSALAGWSMADAVTGKVTSMYLEHYGTDRFFSAYEKGMFRQDVLTSWSMENAEKQVTADYLESCRYLPQIEVDEKLWGQRVETYRNYIRNTRITDSYWQKGWWKQLREIPEKTEIPVFITSSWYDHHHGSSMKTWERLNKKAKEHSWLEIGSWNHFSCPCLQDKKIEHIEADNIPKVLEWFDLTLKKELLPQQRIRIYQIGEDTWKKLESWPPRQRENKVFYLTVPQGNSAQENIGILALQNSGKQAEFSYQYNPENPVETLGGEALLKTGGKIGSLLQKEPGWRKDVLSFLSEPLTEDMRLCGKIQVKLYVKTDCEDTAFTAKIMEVTGEGKAYNIRSSITSLSQEIPEGEVYIPETAVEIRIDMWDIAYTVKQGSRIRIDISSSDFPQYHVHSNYAVPWAEATAVRTACQRILTGGRYPSQVVLPVLKGEAPA